jgi:methionyl-tRNA formyltransferase
MLGIGQAALAPPDTPTGKGVYEHNGHLLLACSGGALELLAVQPPGKRMMDAGAYLRGHAG